MATLVAALAPAASTARGLDTGFIDDVFTGGDSASRDVWLQRTADEAATIVRLDIGWAAARRPGNAADPADPAYDWSRSDAAVDAARAHGLKVLLSFTRMPDWALTRGAPRSVDPATWRPDPTVLRAYGRALATHFAGRVSSFQLWNEPNLSKYLTPQWSHGKPAAPVLYRRMLNAFYAGVKGAQPKALVVTAGTAPFGDFGRGKRMMPVIFWRSVLAKRVRFDALSHHPYSVGGPTRHALNSADVSIPDLGKLKRLLKRAHKKARLWVTEVSYDSSPPDPQGVPAATHARWVEQTLEILWRQGVDTVTWFQIRDQAPQPSYAATNQSGVFRRDGQRKPAATAFRFPLVGSRTSVWTRAPVAGTLVIQRNGRTVRSLHVAAHQVLALKLRSKRGDRLRALLGGELSLTWRI
jgi:hypothetical protein